MREHSKGPSMVGGLIILAIGLLLLLDRNNVIEIGKIWRFWPLTIVFAGLMTLLRQNSIAGRLFGGFLVFAGCLVQLRNLHMLNQLRGDLWWPLILIGIGVILVGRALESRSDPLFQASVSIAGSTSKNVHRLQEWVTFGGGERRVSSQEFEGGELLAVFGGFEIDLRKADLKNNHAVIEANAVFGGIEIKVPETWTVTVRGNGIFGGYSDESHHPATVDGVPAKHLIVNGVAVFGGVEVSN